VNTLLKPFDAALIESVAECSEAVVRALDQKDQAAVRPLLLRLIRFSDGTWTSSPARRDELFSPGEAGRGNAIVEKLREAGSLVVRSTDQGEIVELQYEALMRQWKRLQALKDERAKFREAASFWELKGRHKGALVRDGLADSAADYGDLNNLERQFITESYKHARRFQFLSFSIGGAIVLIIAILVGLYVSATYQNLAVSWELLVFANLSIAILAFLLYKMVYFTYEKWVVPWRAPTKLELARSAELSNETRRKSILWLANHHEALDLEDTPLCGFNLGGLSAVPQSSFARSTLEYVDLQSTVLQGVRFMNSTIIGSNFDSANLQNARFDGATISETSFSGANLALSRFYGASLRDVNFSQADLSGASFQNVSYDSCDLPKFEKTAWWLAIGWSLNQVADFMRNYGGANPRKGRKEGEYLAFDREFNRFESRLEANPKNNLDRAVALDGKAWTLAIHGISLDEAEKAARTALEVIRNVENIPIADKRRKVSYIRDTLAYILMQERQPEEARDLKKGDENVQDPGGMFRYALALHMIGDEDQAAEILNRSMGIRGYLPSHELFLLNEYFSGSGPFMETFARLTEKAPQTSR
jgi:uncharacterized protein YjbI with pentapeptide repeats